MKKILFPFEIGNPMYQDAYIYAVKFARKFNAELTMLNVFDFEIDNNITKEEYNIQIKANWIKAYTEVSKLNNYYLNNHVKVDLELKTKFNYHFVYGKLVNEIRKILTAEKIDMVVLPVSKSKAFNKKQQEIIKDDIFEKNNSSLLVIPEGGAFQPIRDIVFATDLKKLNFHELYLNDILKIASVFTSNIHFLHISNKEDAFLPEDIETYRSIMSIIKMHPNHSFHSLYGKDVINAINNYIQSNAIDLLVVVKHEHYFLDSVFHKSISEQLSLNSQIPVLLMRDKT